MSDSSSDSNAQRDSPPPSNTMETTQQEGTSSPSSRNIPPSAINVEFMLPGMQRRFSFDIPLDILPETQEQNSSTPTSEANGQDSSSPSNFFIPPLLLRIPASQVGLPEAEGANQGRFLYFLIEPTLGADAPNDILGGLPFPMFGGNASSFEDLLDRLMQLHEPRGPPPTSAATIESLPTIEVTSSLIQEQGRCTVCCEDYHEGQENVIQLPCKHAFDRDCVVTWLKAHNTCPVCRFALPTEESESETSTDSIRPSANSEASNEEFIVDAPGIPESPEDLASDVPPTRSNKRTSSERKEAKKNGGWSRGFLNKKQKKEPTTRDRNSRSILRRGFLNQPRRSYQNL